MNIIAKLENRSHFKLAKELELILAAKTYRITDKVIAGMSKIHAKIPVHIQINKSFMGLSPISSTREVIGYNESKIKTGKYTVATGITAGKYLTHKASAERRHQSHKEAVPVPKKYGNVELIGIVHRKHHKAQNVGWHGQTTIAEHQRDMVLYAPIGEIKRNAILITKLPKMSYKKDTFITYQEKGGKALGDPYQEHKNLAEEFMKAYRNYVSKFKDNWGAFVSHEAEMPAYQEVIRRKFGNNVYQHFEHYWLQNKQWPDTTTADIIHKVEKDLFGKTLE